MDPITIEKTHDELLHIFNIKVKELESEWHEHLLNAMGASTPETNRAGSTYRLFWYNNIQWAYIVNPMNDGFEILLNKY